LDGRGEERLAEPVLEKKAPRRARAEERELERRERVVLHGREIGPEHSGARRQADADVARDGRDVVARVGAHGATAISFFMSEESIVTVRGRFSHAGSGSPPIRRTKTAVSPPGGDSGGRSASVR